MIFAASTVDTTDMGFKNLRESNNYLQLAAMLLEVINFYSSSIWRENVQQLPPQLAQAVPFGRLNCPYINVSEAFLPSKPNPL